MKLKLKDLGYYDALDEYRNNSQLDSFEVGRVTSEHKGRYSIRTPEKEYEGEVIGNLRFSAHERADFPAVGDWVAISEYDDNKVLIYAILPRKSTIERKAVGKQGEKQIVATNVDYALVVQAVDRDFNLNRLERYLTICNTSKVSPLIILNKIDLLSSEELQEIVGKVKKRVGDFPLYTISNFSKQGIDKLRIHFERGKTYCLLGSSGVGKSSLLNNLAGTDRMKTNTISDSTNKGRHVTSHRELFVLDGGGILIDNPGMRELGTADSSDGLEMTFESIAELSNACRFKDCTHTSEQGCAILQALENGELDESLYQNYMKMKREQEYFEMTLVQKRKKDKSFGKILKDYKKNMK